MNRFALIAIAVAANCIGLLPYLLFVDHLAYLLVVIPASAMTAFFALRRASIEATARPSLAEWLLGAWSAVGKPSTASLIGLMFFGLFYWGYELFSWAARLFDFAPSGDPRDWGYWGSIWMVAIAAFIGPTEGIRLLSRQLYPSEAWARSAFFPLLARSRIFTAVAAVVCGLVALGAMLWWLDLRGVAFPILLVLLLFYTSFPLAELGRKSSDKRVARVVDALVTLLETAGYRVVRAPRTGKAEIDPLLQSVDLLARGHEHAFAVQVKTVAPNTIVEWNEAAAVRTAAALLSDETVADGGAPMLVEPVLMLVGGKVAQSLEAFSQREGVPVVHLAGADDEFLKLASSDELKRRLQAAGIVLPPSKAAVSAQT